MVSEISTMTLPDKKTYSFKDKEARNLLNDIPQRTYVNSQTQSTQKYYRFAYVDSISGNVDGVFLLRDMQNAELCGIIRLFTQPLVFISTENGVPVLEEGGGYLLTENNEVRAEWLVRTGFDLDSIQIGADLNYADIFIKAKPSQNIEIVILSGKENGWELNKTQTAYSSISDASTKIRGTSYGYTVTGSFDSHKIQNTLTSTSINDYLSAAQGKILNDKFANYATVNSLTNYVTTNSLIDKIYPVGSIYMSVNNVSPEVFIGGSWEQIKDKFLLSSGDIYEAGSEGGEATHKLTKNEIPLHNHSIHLKTSQNGSHTHIETGAEITINSTQNAYSSKIQLNTMNTKSISDNKSTGIPTVEEGSHTHDIVGETDTTGDSSEHNNMPPYLTVYMWKRTA